MQRSLLLVSAAIVAVACASGCKRNQNASEATASASTPPMTPQSNAADQANSAATSSNNVVAGAEDATAAAIGSGAAAMDSRSAKGFVTAAAISDMYEVDAAKLAEQRSHDPAIKKFAAMMLKDHSATTKKLQSLLPGSGVNVAPPSDLDERRKGMLDNLRKASDADFDKRYMDQQVAAHTEALSLFKGYADHGDNAALKQFAAATAPKIREHLDNAKTDDKATTAPASSSGQ